MMKTISTAESCTGGRIAAAITARSGASRYFEGGLVAYQNEVKERMLGVPREMIERYGVVSREVAEQMVKGACRLFHTDYALASTGYAEPWEGHEVEIWVAWGTEKEVHSTCLREDFGRVKNVEIATRCVMDEFEKYRDAIDD
jgi:nicotinamide-nucleotide amidase